MIKLCDLHTHSVFSDGTCTPAEIIDSAISAGLSAIALSDHNTALGLPDFLAYAEGKSIEAVAGVEFSVDYDGKELHLLGLFIPPEHFDGINKLMEEYSARKEQSNIELVESLARSGIILDYDLIKSKTPGGKINRAHIAAEMTAKGYTESIKQAFDEYLSLSAGHYKEPKRQTVWEMIDYINSIGAVPVLAHPFLNLSESELDKFLPLAKARGLVGMECVYSTYNEETTAKAFEMAKAYGLKFSGGSDFHGANKPDISLGIGKGNLQVPYQFVLELRN